MSLQVWIPGTENLNNQGLSSSIITQGGTYISSGGKIGKGCINASNMIINYGPGKAANLTSVTFWHKWNGTVPTGWITTFYFPYNSGQKRYYLATNESHFYPAFASQGGNTKFTLDSNWHHIALVGTDSKLIVYIDGIEDRTIPGNAFTLEGNAFFTSCYLNDIRIYDHSLSPKEVHEIAKGLVLHYPMNDEYAESTVNIIGSDTCGSLSNGTWGGHTYTSIKYTITSSDPVPFKECQKHTLTYSGSGSGGSSTYYVSVPVKGNTTYCYSRYIKASDNLAYTSANFLYRYEYANSTYVTEVGVFSNSRKEYIGNGWYRCWGVFTTRPETTSLNLHFFTYPNKNVEYLLGGILLEEKDHMTPYTPTTRNELVYDCSGYYNNGTVTGSLQVVDDSPRYRNSVSSNGNQKITAPIGLDIPSNNLTVSCWIKRPEVIDSYTMRCFLNTGFTNNNRFYFRILPQGNTAIFNVGFGANTYGTKTIDANWHHLAVTTESDGKTINIYVDGIKTNTGTELNTFTIAGNFILLDYFIGKISDFRFYRTTLSEDDIKELYNTSAIINNNNTLEAYEFLEADTYSINKSGVLEGEEFIEQDGNVLINNTEQVFATEFTEI